MHTTKPINISDHCYYSINHLLSQIITLTDSKHSDRNYQVQEIVIVKVKYMHQSFSENHLHVIKLSCI